MKPARPGPARWIPFFAVLRRAEAISWRAYGAEAEQRGDFAGGSICGVPTQASSRVLIVTCFACVAQVDQMDKMPGFGGQGGMGKGTYGTLKNNL